MLLIIRLSQRMLETSGEAIQKKEKLTPFAGKFTGTIFQELKGRILMEFGEKVGTIVGEYWPDLIED
ncbi:hypothetical protein QE152_g26385 [Popillia japonica]|uniref:Uncharacterized protein n=1 Tax=Popillia japonica TaxID=7064 RepID=A0AAW1JYZ3_POPJA